MKPPSPRHKLVLKMLKRRGSMNTHQVAGELRIPIGVATTMLHYMEERGMVLICDIGRGGKRGYPPVWIVNGNGKEHGHILPFRLSELRGEAGQIKALTAKSSGA